MPEPGLIGSYLDQLAARLPAAIVTELADGLHETYESHRRRGLSPEDAAKAAVAEFGAATTVAAAFDAISPARHWARTMLRTGPVVGAAWAAVLLTRHAPGWPLMAGFRAGLGVVILAGVILLAAAAFRAGYRQSGRNAVCGSLIVLAADLAMLGYVTSAGILTTWPVLLAAALSAARIRFTLSRFPRVLACR
jgi:hypothetical protein